MSAITGINLSIPTASNTIADSIPAKRVNVIVSQLLRPPVLQVSKSLTPVFPRMVQYHTNLENLLARDTVIEKIAEGLEWTEGPVWNKKEKSLLFSDIPRNSIYQWKPNQNISLYLYPSGYTGRMVFRGKEPGSNGLTYDKKGNLYACQHGDRRVVKFDQNKEPIPIAEHYQGKRLNSPNDLVFNAKGDLYFTDPTFGLPLRNQDPERELPFAGVYRVKNGKLELLTKELKTPNGIAFSPDEKYLYISNSGVLGSDDRPAWYRFTMNEDGTLGKKELFFDASRLKEVLPGSPDGLKVDNRGNLYCCGPGGVYLFSPEAVLLGVIEFGTPTSNCNWGEDGSRLYITANHAVYRVAMKNKGAAF